MNIDTAMAEIPPSSQKLAAVTTLVKDLQKARTEEAMIRDDGMISLFKDTRVTLQPFLQSRFEAELVEFLVQAYESDDGSFCRRLDFRMTLLLGNIMRLSVECQSQLRGYCMLAECLFEGDGLNPRTNHDTGVKKQGLSCNEIIHVAFRRFLDSRRSDHARRACGFFTFTLLVDNSKAREAMLERYSDEVWLSLGDIVLSHNSELLKLIAGSIIRDLIQAGLSEDKFWSADDTPAAVIEKFPRPGINTSQWLWGFHEFLAETVPRDHMDNDDREITVFAHMIGLRHVVFEMGKESVILVTVGTMLSIMIPANNVRNTIYLDVYFGGILDVKISLSDSQSQGRSHQTQSQVMTPSRIDIILSNHGSWNYLMNDKRCLVDQITIVVDYKEDAEMVEQAIMARRSGSSNTVSPSQLESDAIELPTSTLVYRSEPLDISVDRQGTEPTSGLLTDNDGLAAVASDAITHMAESHSEDHTAREIRDAHVNPADEMPSHNSEQRKPGSAAVQQPPTTDLKALPVTQEINTSRPRTTRLPLGHKKPHDRTNDSHVTGPSQKQIKDKARLSQNSSVVRKPVAIATRQELSAPNASYDLSPHGPNVIHRSGTHEASVPEEKSSVQQAAKLKPGKSKLSRQLRDDNSHLSPNEPSEIHEPERQSAHSLKTKRQSSVLESTSHRKRPQEPRGNPSTRAASNVLKIGALGQRRRASQMSYHDDENGQTGALQVLGKKHNSSRAPQAPMISKSQKPPIKEQAPLSNVGSNSARAHPKAQARPSQVQQHSGYAKTKTRNLNVADEQVDWSEDLHEDDISDVTPPPKAKTTKKKVPPAKSNKGASGPTQARKTLPTKPAATLASQKPRRAAAVKAYKKIQGLSEPVAQDLQTAKTTKEKGASNTKPATAQEQAPPPITKASSSNKAPNMVTKTTKHKNMSPPKPEAVPPPKPTAAPVAAQTAQSPSLADDPVYFADPEERTSAPLRPNSVPEDIDPCRLTENVPRPHKISEPSGEKSIGSPMGRASHTEVKGNSVVANVVQAQQPVEEFAERASIGELHVVRKGDDALSETLLDLRNSASLTLQAKSTTNIPQEHDIDFVEALDDLFDIPATPVLPQAHPRVSSKRRDDENVISRRLPDRSTLSRVREAPKPPQPRASSREHGQTDLPLAKEPDVSQGRSQPEHLQGTVGSGVGVPTAPTQTRITTSKLNATSHPIPTPQDQGQKAKTSSVVHVAEGGRGWGEKYMKPRITGDITGRQEPDAVRLISKQKRRLEEAESRPVKKARAAPWQPASGPHVARAEIGLRTPNNDAPAIPRKPILIQFDASGPRNQGTLSAQKTNVSDDLANPLLPAAFGSGAARDRKRKHVQAMDAHGHSDDHRPEVKRRKREHTNRPLADDRNVSLLSKKANLSTVTERVRFQGSQSSRVDEHGSPLPFHHSRHASLAMPRVGAPTQKALLDGDDFSDIENFDFQEEGVAMPEPTLPFATQKALPPVAEPRVTVASNTKHRPSSPNAPSSIITDMRAHRIQPGGLLVGLRSHEVVVPQKPQDPFIEAAQDRPINKFMETLRKSSNIHKREERAGQKEQGMNGVVSNNLGANDPDKTLIDEDLSRGEHESSTATESRSSSRDSESEDQAEADPSDDGDDPSGAWNKALRADQRGIFVRLCEIGHCLTQNLIDKETAIEDIINDFGRQGKWIIDRFEQERWKELDVRRATKKKTTTELCKTFQSVEKDCAIRVNKSGEDMTGFRSDIRARQAKMDASVERMLALC